MRYSNCPTLIDELRSFTVSDLKKLGYLKKGTCSSGTVNWKNRFNEVTSSMSITVNYTEHEKYLELNYKCDNQTINYKINLITAPSNLGKGYVVYFLCPFTNKRCVKLHLINSKFMHRSALINPLYSVQVESKKGRALKKSFSRLLNYDKCYDELYAKGFTKYYNGKPTKRYLKIKNIIGTQCPNISLNDFK